MSPSDADRRPCGVPGLTSRRGFLGQIGLAAAAAAPASAGPAERPEDYIPAGAMPVSLRVNGARHDLQLDSRTTLLDALRLDACRHSYQGKAGMAGLALAGKILGCIVEESPPGPGFMEESIVNVRVRNSSPRDANRAVERNATTIAERVQRELDQYGMFNMNTLRRRCRLMLRPLVLYRHFANEPPLEGVSCPPGSA